MTSTLPATGRTYYSTATVAALTGISERTLQRHLPKEFGPIKVGTALSWSRAAVDRWVRGEVAA
jgi:predicted DNA-binding transcriptional regulator AlpA